MGQTNEAILVKFEITAAQDSEAMCLIKILPLNQIVKCFIDYSELQKWKVLKEKQKLKVKIKLCYFDVKESIESKKAVKSIWSINSPAVSYYRITGQVIKELNGVFLIDCGLNIIVDPEETDKKTIRRGKWLTFKGRLDAFLID